ncbi:hypothetical protein RRG08_041453 [Elysia crispata]|uniref:Uncharacterized protein n=1 Tax=Elysia crispata TaxID=231223 RepID=A0AAE1BAJ8_9GAST|nr:hypothetical protein RRG08_041453 [Elysia crispata]
MFSPVSSARGVSRRCLVQSRPPERFKERRSVSSARAFPRRSLVQSRPPERAFQGEMFSPVSSARAFHEMLQSSSVRQHARRRCLVQSRPPERFKEMFSPVSSARAFQGDV